MSIRGQGGVTTLHFSSPIILPCFPPSRTASALFPSVITAQAVNCTLIYVKCEKEQACLINQIPLQYGSPSPAAVYTLFVKQSPYPLPLQ